MFKTYVFVGLSNVLAKGAIITRIDIAWSFWKS